MKSKRLFMTLEDFTCSFEVNYLLSGRYTRYKHAFCMFYINFVSGTKKEGGEDL